MSLNNYVDRVGPPVSAAELNALDYIRENWSKTNAATDTGVVNALAVAQNALITATGAVSFGDGSLICVRPAVTNTGAATLSVNGGTANRILTQNLQALSAGQLVQNTPAILVCRATPLGSTNWILMNPTYPLQNVFVSAYRTTNLALTSGVFAPIVFDTELIDVGIS